MSLLANSNAIESGGYNIQRSLRFRSSASAYLSRTPASASNRKTWTWSGWVKRGALGVQQGVFGSGSSVGVYSTSLQFASSGDSLVFQHYSNSPNYNLTWTTSAVFRDPSAWYHIILVVDTTQASSANAVKLYVNNTQQTLTFAAIAGSYLQNQDWFVNSTNQHQIGQYYSGNYFDGYLAEVNFIDGQALTPSSFGQTDAVTGVWTPKKYTGTYGTNGFYLPFSDNTSATTLAYDKSGNGNNWTPNNISTTAGATYDSMTDVPTLTSSTAANYSVINPLSTAGGTFSNGNLDWASPSATDGRFCLATMPVNNFNCYCEVTIGSMTGFAQVGVYGNPTTFNPRVQYRSDGQTNIDGVVQTSFASYTTGDNIGIAYNASTGSVSFYKNGTLQGSMTVSNMATIQYFAAGSNTSGVVNYTFNFGQRPFSYTPPTGFKALNTFNLPDPTIKKPNQYMDATTYTGNGTNQSITNVGGFQPDLVWVKVRNQAYSHNLTDSVRGAPKALWTDQTTAEGATAGIVAFNSNGFQVNGSLGELGTNANNYVGWQWKKGATPGFDIVTYTGNGTSQNISHSLGVAPKMMIIKSRSQAVNWLAWHASLTTPATAYLLLNLTDAQSNTPTTVWNSTVPTSTVFSVGSNTSVNNNASTYVAYLFSEIAGFSKFGGYTGNGSADGPFMYCGFRPKYVMQKRTDTAGYEWELFDTARNPYNITDLSLAANSSRAEVSGGTPYDLTSNGFKVRSTSGSYNANGATYIYAAFAENPFKYSLAR